MFSHQPTKTKATKAMVKQSLHNRQEHVNLNPLAGVLPDISQQCLNDARWTQIFLPTLTHALYISAHPFTDWTWCSSKFFDAVQKVFDLTFTNVSYTLRREDSIVKAVCLIWTLIPYHGNSLMFFGRPMTKRRLGGQSSLIKS